MSSVRALAINCGSSSLKYAAFELDATGERELLRGSVERIGEQLPDQTAAVHAAVDALEQKAIVPDVVGHRVVHGGAARSEPAVVDPALLTELEALVPFAPLHLPAELAAIRALGARWPDKTQVACFDTAFHRSLAEIAQRYALPASLHQKGVRRYGFHGLSYEYVVAALGGPRLGRAVIAHLGNGASMAAVRDGRSVDTTMGFTPSGGLVMGTRTGDLDPGLLIYLVEHGRDAGALDDLVNHHGGLLALSETTADVRDLLEKRTSDPRAQLALDVFAWSARKWVGALAATLGGLDALVFTGGIGEHAAPVRTAIADGLAHLGVVLEPGRNDTAGASSGGIISRDQAPCVVRVVHTDEERMVARHAAQRLAAG